MSVAALIRYRLGTESLVRRLVATVLPTRLFAPGWIAGTEPPPGELGRVGFATGCRIPL